MANNYMHPDNLHPNDAGSMTKNEKAREDKSKDYTPGDDSMRMGERNLQDQYREDKAKGNTKDY